MATVRSDGNGRRQFLSQAGAAAAALATAAVLDARRPAHAIETAAPTPLNQQTDGQPAKDQPIWPLAIFSKVFQKCSFDELAGLVDDIGADGVEIPIRRGGHIEPADAATRVPQLVAALAKHGKRLLIASTDVNAADPAAETLLKTLRDAGVTHYRTGYYQYADAPSRWDQLRQFTDQAHGLAELNQRVGIVGVYQNHAGPRYLGSLLWDLAQLMHEVQSPWLGVALDLRHTRAEIGVSWPAMVQLIQPSVRTIFAKNTTWKTAADPQSRPRLTEVPLADGLADAAMFRPIWQSIATAAPLSVHVEYLGQQPRAIAETAALVAAYQADVATLRQWMA